jgi:hypothetical protein
MADEDQPVEGTTLSAYAKDWIEGRASAPPLLRNEYATLRSTGLTPFGALMALRRLRPMPVDILLEWFARKNPEAGAFRERWIRQQQAENLASRRLVGAMEEGCYDYFSISNRATRAVLIKWDEIENIYVQDGQNTLVLGIFSPGEDGGKFMHGHSDMPDFDSFVAEVSGRFFESRGYLNSLFKRGDHEVRRFQVWPKKRSGPGVTTIR